MHNITGAEKVSEWWRDRMAERTLDVCTQMELSSVPHTASSYLALSES